MTISQGGEKEEHDETHRGSIRQEQVGEERQEVVQEDEQEGDDVAEDARHHRGRVRHQLGSVRPVHHHRF